MDVFHCQRCGHWPKFEVGTTPTRQPYSMTSCGAICCATCVQAGRQSGNKCPLCNGGCKMMEINSQINAEMKTYFKEPHMMIQESMQKAFQVMQFQRRLQKSAVRLVGHLMNYQKAMKAENQTLKSQVTSLMQANKTMKEEMENLKRKNTELQNTIEKQQSPPFHTPINQNNSNGNNGDIFNFLRQSPNRPNAQVQPIVQLQQANSNKPSPPPRSRERFVARDSQLATSQQTPLFSVPPGSFRFPRAMRQYSSQASSASSPGSSVASTPSSTRSSPAPPGQFNFFTPL